jgi:OOP family OmpA-OmpF porin
VGVGQVRLEEDVAGIEFKGTDTGFKLFGGYQFHENFAAELAFIDAGKPDDTVFGVTIGSDASAVQASLIGTVPVGNRAAIYLRAAILAWEATSTATDGFDYISEDVDGTDFSYGVGARLNFSPRFGLRAEFEGADLDGTDYTFMSLSGVFAF